MMEDASRLFLRSSQDSKEETRRDITDLTNNEGDEAAVSETAGQQQEEESSVLPHPQFWGAVANLCSATLGAGILGLPYAFQKAGWIWATILLLCSAVATYWSLEVLAEACSVLQECTYEGLTQQVLGLSARRLTEVCMLVFCIGCAVAYVVAVGDILEPIVGDARSRGAVMMLAWCVAMLPLSLLRSMEHLQYASSIGIVAICMLIVSAIVHLDMDRHAENDDSQKDDSLFVRNSPLASSKDGSMISVIQACPILLFAFSCQVNVCAIYQEYPDKARFRPVLYTAVAVCTALYATISITTLLDTTGSTTTMIPPNVLQLYCPQGLWQLTFWSMAIAVVVAFPLNIFPARVTLEGLLCSSSSSSSPSRYANETLQQALLLDMEEQQQQQQEEDNVHDEEEASHQAMQETESTPRNAKQRIRHVLLTVAIAGSALALALVVPNITVVFGLLGGSTSSILGFVLPGWVGVKMQQRNSSSSRYYKAWILLVGGIVVAVVTTAVTVYTTLFVPPSTNVAGVNTHDPNPCHDQAHNNNNNSTVWQVMMWGIGR